MKRREWQWTEAQIEGTRFEMLPNEILMMIEKFVRIYTCRLCRTPFVCTKVIIVQEFMEEWPCHVFCFDRHTKWNVNLFGKGFNHTQGLLTRENNNKKDIVYY